jgi:hypothetical protein
MIITDEIIKQNSPVHKDNGFVESEVGDQHRHNRKLVRHKGDTRNVSFEDVDVKPRYRENARDRIHRGDDLRGECGISSIRKNSAAYS